jgi:hypothetical protein
MTGEVPRAGSGVGAGPPPGGDGDAAPSRLRLLAYAAVAAPLVVGLAAAAGAGARLIDGRAGWPAKLVVASLLVVVAGAVAHRLNGRVGRGGSS